MTHIERETIDFIKEKIRADEPLMTSFNLNIIKKLIQEITGSTEEIYVGTVRLEDMPVYKNSQTEVEQFRKIFLE